MKKKILAAVLALACSLSLSACAPSQGVTLEFSEYYQSADNFEEIEPLLNQYFSMVQAAYDNSDKTNLESFVLDDGYEEVADALKEISDEVSDGFSDALYKSEQGREAYAAQLRLLQPYLFVEYKIAEQNLLLSANYDHLEKPAWFTELEDKLSDTYSEYAEGDGED